MLNVQIETLITYVQQFNYLGVAESRGTKCIELRHILDATVRFEDITLGRLITYTLVFIFYFYRQSTILGNSTN